MTTWNTLSEHLTSAESRNCKGLICVYVYSWLQECQFLPGHTKQSVCGEWLCCAETLPWLFPLSEWHGCSVAWLLQPAQARETPVSSAWWLLPGGLLRASARLQLWITGSLWSRWGWDGEWRTLHVQNALQRPRHHAQQRAPSWQLRSSYAIWLLLPDSPDIW